MYWPWQMVVGKAESEQGRPKEAQVAVHDSPSTLPYFHATPAAVKVAERVEVAEDVDVPEPVAEDVDDAEAVAVRVAVDDAVMVAVAGEREGEKGRSRQNCAFTVPPPHLSRLT